jgi:hypothetical protein
MKIWITIGFVVSLIATFIGGIIYADRTSGVPKNEIFRVESYFNNLRKVDLSLIDGEYLYFTYNTGASQEEAEDYKNHPENYAEYEADLFIANHSQSDIQTIWATYPGTEVYSSPYEGYRVRKYKDIFDRKIWVGCYLSEGVAFVSKNGEFCYKLRFVVKTEGLSEEDVLNLLRETQINLQLGLCEESLNSQYDISRYVGFEFPVTYKSE